MKPEKFVEEARAILARGGGAQDTYRFSALIQRYDREADPFPTPPTKPPEPKPKRRKPPSFGRSPMGSRAAKEGDDA
jgi:hypothetical protein